MIIEIPNTTDSSTILFSKDILNNEISNVYNGEMKDIRFLKGIAFPIRYKT
jgi:hypothetical protein